MTELSICSTKLINKLKHPRRQFQILIVDDDIGIAETFGEILKQRGHNITIAHKGTSCINKCLNSNYDIIFLDFHLTDINGTDITDMLKNSCNNNSIIFAFTGDDSISAINQFKNIGMTGAIIKPIDLPLINNFMNSLELRNSVDTRVVSNIPDPKYKKQLFVFDQKFF